MTQITPLVSVVIATYNRSNVLKYAISSVLRQQYQHFEIIVIGDHCTDDTEKVINSFADERIHFLNLEQNFGEQSYPNNIGFQKSKGELIAWLNHDDLWFPDHLVSLIRTLNETNADLAYSWFLPYNAEKHGSVYNLPAYTEKSQYHPCHFVPASSWLVRRRAVEEVGGWKSAREIYNIPSQEWINRLFKRGKNIV